MITYFPLAARINRLFECNLTTFNDGMDGMEA